MQGEYILDRLLPDFVGQACNDLGYTCTRFSDDWVLRIDGNNKRQWVIGYTFDLNGAGAVSVASDKVAASLALSAENMPVAMHYLVRSHAEQSLLIENLGEIDEHKPVVIKPLSGSGGRGVKLMDSITNALKFVESSSHPDWAISPFYDVMSEKRVIMLDGRVLCSYDKTQPYIQDGLAMFNLGQGAVAVNCSLTNEEANLAARALESSGLRVASVDIATLNSGQLMIMEINSGITMEHYARQSEEYFVVSQSVYYDIIEAMMNAA